MKILILTKRQYTNKDLIDDKYGRLWEIPFCLSEENQVKCICLSYRNKKEGDLFFDIGNDKVSWVSFNISSIFRYLFYIKSQIESFKPDVIWASSDCLHVVMGFFWGKLFHIPCVIDLYDNYESFILSKYSGIIPIYRYAVRNADAISAVSHPLAKMIRNRYRNIKNIQVIENAINDHLFYPLNIFDSRKYFNLPNNVKIIGTAGALDDSRGISVFYQAFEVLSKHWPNLHLAVAGVGSRKHSVFKNPKVHDLGVLSHKDTAFFYNALDVAVICNKNTTFGRYAFPQKAYEILACNTPVVVAKLGALEEVLKDYPQCLYEPDNQADLQSKIENLLLNPQVIDIPIPTWKDQAVKLLDWIQV